MNGEDTNKKSIDQVGSEEFYEGDNKAEEPKTPVEKEEIKAETVKKEEIYEDKIKRQEAFIANLGRKKEAKEKPNQRQPKYIEEKNPPAKKIAYSFLGIIILGALAGSYWFWSKKNNEAISKEAENKVATNVDIKSSDKSKEEQLEPEKVPVEEIKPAEIKIKVLNEGAPVGSAGKNKEFLISKGYAKTEAGNGELDSTNSFIYYNGPEFKSAAEKIKEILSGNKIQALVKEALTAEQKSGNVVVILGK